MKQKLLILLAALIGLLGKSMGVSAQDVPEPTAQWSFNNAEDLMAPDKGSLTLTPALLGAKSITPSTLSETEIVQTAGPTDTDKAIYVPKKAALKVSRAEGADTLTAYTIMMDILVPNATEFNGLLQMDETNNNDGDLFTNKNQIGIGSMGYAGNIKVNRWYRVVFTYDESNPAGTQARLYLNGKKIKEGGANTRHIMAPFGFYLLCDEDGEKVEYTCLSEVAFWETPLTDAEACKLGRPTPRLEMEIATAADLLTFAEKVVNGNDDAYGVLTSDIQLTDEWVTPIGIDGEPFTGIFDGQGHTISGLNGTSTGKFGLFGYIKEATVKNFSIGGELSATSAHGTGAIGWSESSSISNVHSSLVISVPVPGVHHVAGVVGSAQYHNRITGCTFDGSVTVGTGNNDNFAGVAGYIAEDTLLYCANYGTITFEDKNCSAGGIAGYLNNNKGYIKHCLNVGSIVYNLEGVNPDNGGAIVGRQNTGYTVDNIQTNYWLEGSTYTAFGGRTLPTTSAATFTADQMPTGELCYKLNGDQTEIGWYQAIGTDDQPVLDATHGQVYMVGRLHCNGDVYADATYSNTYSETTQDDHDPVDGLCSYCGLFYEDFFTPNADGFYEIANARQLAWFEQKVNKGTLDANAILTADIDFADMMPEGATPEETEVVWTPIGDWGRTRGVSNAPYKGHFDGQGHTIKNFNASSAQEFFGLFGVLSTNAIVENFTIYGNINNPTNQQYMGLIAFARDQNVTIRNIHSCLNLNNARAGGRQGGILGCSDNGTINIEGCAYSGDFLVSDAGGSGNYGGIVGYLNSNTAAILNITNCLFDGKVININDTPGDCTLGGIIGYANTGVGTIKNCLSIGTVESARYAQFFGALNGPNSKIINSYYQGEYINGSSSRGTANPSEATFVSVEELYYGEVTWKLNERTFIDPAWHQTLSDDDYPLPYGNGAIIYETPDGYSCVTPDDPASVSSFISSEIAIETTFITETVAYQVLLDKYATEVKSWESIETLEAFLEAYKASMELKDSINTSAAQYAAYVQTCKDAAQYIEDNNLQGGWTDFLLTYLKPTEALEPSDSYPNGSYAYIMEELNLDYEALALEIDFVNKMLENAIAGGLMPGTEITRLLANPTFEDGYEGWTVEYEGGTADVGGNTSIMPIPEAFNNKSFNASQTLTELPNGIYMMALNGLFRAGSDVNSQFYAGQLYLNDTYNYFMSPGEDPVEGVNAEPGVNCLGEGTDDVWYEDIKQGWVPNSRNGCSVAFSAGRYVNYVATEITDSTLTIGTRNLGTGLANDWMPFGNLHIYYLGTAEEANSKLTTVLAGYKARAEVILDFLWSDSSKDNVHHYPNFSEELKDQLQRAVDSAEQAATGESKMILINRFSELFNQIYACRKAYIALYDAANNMYDIAGNLLNAGLITEESYDEWSAKADEAQENYVNGDVTAEQALAIAEELNNANLISLAMVDGAYQLASAEDLQFFAKLVNFGMNTSNAVLVNDIDMDNFIEEDWTAIGDWHTGNTKSAYAGHFDGQGHTIKNFHVTAPKNFFGLFGVITTGCLIENFSIYGTLNTNFQYAGPVAAYARDDELAIRNVHSYVDINNTCAGGRQGGILGGAHGTLTILEGCTYSGTLGASDTGGSGNYGGILGYANNSSSCVINITNCLFDGKVVNTAASPGNCTFGGIVGYANAPFVTISNCLSIGKVQSARYAQFFGALNGSNSKILNSYYQGDNITGSGSGGTASPQEATKVTDEQLASGEICFKLNGEQPETVWYQTIIEDNYPVLDRSHETVLYSDEYGFYNEIDGIIVGIKDLKESEDVKDSENFIYNLAGQRLQKMQKGINIINGKKVLK